MGLHYIPQQYQRKFEDRNRPGFIWVHDIRGREAQLAPIKKVAQVKGYYSADDEKRLADYVELPGNRAIDKLIAEKPLSDAERIDFAIYVATMMSRVPFRRRVATEMIPGVLEQIGADYRKTVAELIADGQIDPEKAAGRLRELDAALQKYGEEPPSSVTDQIRDPWPTETIVIAILSMGWHVLKVKGPQPFITCDNPVNFLRGYGLGHAEAELVMPLSPSRAFYASRRFPGGFLGLTTVRPAMVREINMRLIFDTERLVLSHESSPWVFQLFRNRRPARLKLGI